MFNMKNAALQLQFSLSKYAEIVAPHDSLLRRKCTSYLALSKIFENRNLFLCSNLLRI